ncbi:MAG: hypothetical protein ACOC0U_02720 [Desulfovibrionales bacterium]
MQEIFHDLYSLENVQGILFLSPKGEVMYTQRKNSAQKDPESINWLPLVQSLNQVKEADLLFEKNRFYIRQAYEGYIIVSMTNGKQASLVRLNCDLVMPSLKKLLAKTKSGSKLSRFFRK